VILVTGATGPTGSAATRALLDRGEQVRVLTRSRERAESMPELDGAEIWVGDPSDVGSVDQAFDGVEKVYLVPPLAPGWNAMQGCRPR
jgi:uncharacterized protein YbjT (DUF2867 family)